jgi:transposase
MINDLKNLTLEPKLLQEIVWSLTTKNKDLETENEFLREQLRLFRARKFGKSSEKSDRQLEMLELQVEESEESGAIAIEAEETAKTGADKKRPKRQKLPDHLPRTDILLPPEETCPDCGGVEFRKIGDDISETLEYVPSSFKVNRYIRPRCACVNCEKVVQACVPSKTIDKGKAGAGLLAHIMVQKYCNHLPLYRQSQMYEREGVEISRSTLASWVKQSATLLEPVIEEIRTAVFSAKHLHGDDTPIKVLAPGAGKTKTGRLWTYVKDGRPHGDTTPPAVCYYYSPDRKGERPLEHLKNFKGVLHADAYAGYNALYVDKGKPEENITEAACWAHTRRKFYEVTVANDEANIAMEVLEEIGKIYEIESKIRGLEPGIRLEQRQKLSKEMVAKLFANLKKYQRELPKKSTTAQAIGYALGNEVALKRFLGDGKIEIDNNAAERAMRSIALGRKNWLFAGSDIGGSSAATMYTLIETAKLNGLNPWEYLRAVFERIQDHPISKIAELLPWNIKLD